MSHPCATHMDTCDHCYWCEEMGICCETVPLNVRQAVARHGNTGDLSTLRRAIQQDLALRTDLAALLIEDSSRPVTEDTTVPIVHIPRITPAAGLPDRSIPQGHVEERDDAPAPRALPAAGRTSNPSFTLRDFDQSLNQTVNKRKE